MRSLVIYYDVMDTRPRSLEGYTTNLAGRDHWNNLAVAWEDRIMEGVKTRITTKSAEIPGLLSHCCRLNVVHGKVNI